MGPFLKRKRGRQARTDAGNRDHARGSLKSTRARFQGRDNHVSNYAQF